MTATDGQTTAGQGLVARRNGISHDAPPVPGLVRGACPSLAAPMQTGDGLLVRLRPSSPGLTPGQLRDLARAAARHGNGLLEITARGNIQLRGLSAQTMVALARDIDRAGIVPEAGLVIETPSLSGRDHTEIADARAMAARLRQVLAALPAALTLAPKLAVIVDGRGLFNMDAVSADIRLKATGPDRWEVSVGERTHPVFAGSADRTLETTIDLLKALNALGPRARARDLPKDLLAQQSVVASTLAAKTLSSKSLLGGRRLGPDTVLLGVIARYGQIPAEKLIALLDAAEAAGADEVRTAPGHVLLLLSVTPNEAEKLRATAAALGFDADADMPSSQIASCSGAGACASGRYRTKDLSADLVEWIPDLFDGSLTFHVSGCPKGCAHPGAAAIAIVGVEAGYAIVLDGAASGSPAVIVDKFGLKSALLRAAGLVRDSKAAGESVKACLERLGGEAIAAALRQE